MFRIVEKCTLAPGVHRYQVEAPLVANSARPGNFVVVRTSETGERIPLTIAGHDREAGTITLVVQEVGKSTIEMGMLEPGDSFRDVAGPWPATRIELELCCWLEDRGRASMPQIRAHKSIGNHVISIVGARTRDLLVLTDEVEKQATKVKQRRREPWLPWLCKRST